MLDYILLTLLIIGPILLSLLVVVVASEDEKSFRERLKSAIFLSEDKGLAHQGLLHLSLLVPSLYFIFFGFIIWKDYEIDISGKGINLFFSISEVPLLFLSLSVPLTALVSRMHATKQTAKQIKITELNNNIDLFSAHRNNLFVYFDHITEVEYLDEFVGRFNVHAQIHKIFFSGTEYNGAPIVNNKSFDQLAAELSDAKNHLENLFYIDLLQEHEDHSVMAMFEDDEFDYNGPSGYYYRHYRDYCSIIYKLAKNLFLSEVKHCFPSESIYVYESFASGLETYTWRTIGKTSDHAITVYCYIYQYYAYLCQFSDVVVPNKDIEKFFNDIDSKSIEPQDDIIEILHKSHLKDYIQW